jgi:gluconolactonase
MKLKFFISILIFQTMAYSQKKVGKIISLDASFDKLIAPNAELVVISEGYDWSEGPVWVKNGGYLLFSDVPKNTIYKWKDDQTTVFLSPSGYTGLMPYSKEPGSNGLSISHDGQLIACEHGDRRISKMPLHGLGGKFTLSDNFNGKRFNSPNDLVESKKGDIYFTDPPYGLPQYEKDPSRETDIFGVYKIDKNRKTTLIISDLIRPNGVALSPDEKTLYVAQSDRKAYIMAYPILENGNVGQGKLFFDASYLNKEGLRGAPDGLKVDLDGNVFSSGPGGLIVLNKNGKLIGRVETGQATSNLAWGEDGSTLFITADMYILKLKTLTKGF